MAQIVIVALLVVACVLNAAWILAPGAGRRSIAKALLGLSLPLPVRLATRLRTHAAATSAGCACDGCEGAPAAKKNASPGTVAPITFHRRLPH